MNENRKRQIEFGDFQTPDDLALNVCQRLAGLGICPDIVIEPTCGIGSFIVAACQTFPQANEIYGFEINHNYLDVLRARLTYIENAERVRLKQTDFFATDWHTTIGKLNGSVLVIGNFPWVTNSTQSIIGANNLPEKTNFQGHNGFEAISGKANFDISEWMLLEVLRWFKGRVGNVAMLIKTAVARKILAHAERQGTAVQDAFMISIDAKKHFGAAVEACLLVMCFTDNTQKPNHDYMIFDSLYDEKGRRVGHRGGLIVGDLATFSECAFLVGQSPQKWRSGVKHDASAVMEFTHTAHGLKNGFGEVVEIESDYLFPLLKGSDIGGSLSVGFIKHYVSDW